MANLLSGPLAAASLRERLASDIAACKTPPALCVVQVGANPSSDSYIRQKQKNAAEWGLRFEHLRLPAQSSIAQIEATLTTAQKQFDGVILQLPLDRDQPTSADEVSYLLAKIQPDRDADGLHPANLGRVVCGESTADQWRCPIPATALGVMRMLDHYGVKLKGENVTVIGKSRLVGMPLSILLMHRGATVSICHSKTNDLAQFTRESSLVIAAAGCPGLLTEKHFTGKQTVIDVGTTVVDKKLRGDLSPTAYDKLAAYSPVPGGVGPMTVAALMENTYRLHASRT